MKTSQIARGIVGALSLAGVIGAVGCSAGYDGEGAAGEGEIGETSQAITSIAGIAATGLTAAEFPATCVVTDTFNNAQGTQVTREVMLVAGGYDSTGAAVSGAALYDAVDNRWIATTSLPEVRGEAKMIKISATECLLVGGFTNKTANPATGVTQARMFNSNGSSASLWNQAGSTTARVKSAFSKCGTGSNAILIGGESTARAALNDIEIYNGETGTTAWGKLRNVGNTANVPLAVSRMAFGIATEDNQNFFIHSGWDGAGTVNSIELLRTNASCAGAATSSFAITGQNRGLRRFAHVAIPTGTSNEFAVVTGDTGAALTRVKDVYDVVFSPPSVTIDAGKTNATEIAAADVQRFATLVDLTGGTYYTIGGETSVATLLGGTPVTAVNEFIAGALTDTDDLAAARLGSGAEYLATPDKVFVAMGKSTGGTWLASAEAITP